MKCFKIFKQKKFRYFIYLTITFGIGFMFFCDWLVKRKAKPIYSDVSYVPKERVGILLGCNRLAPGGVNLFYLNRIKATVELYNSGKIERVLISGDHGREGYNEPEDMKYNLMQAGIPEAHITLDYAGFSTLDSMIRAHKVFQLESFTVISQSFHCERAIFIAKGQGIKVQGFAAKDVSGAGLLYSGLREKLARVKAFLQVYILHSDPKFLGESIRVK